MAATGLLPSSGRKVLPGRPGGDASAGGGGRTAGGLGGAGSGGQVGGGVGSGGAEVGGQVEESESDGDAQSSTSGQELDGRGENDVPMKVFRRATEAAKT